MERDVVGKPQLVLRLAVVGHRSLACPADKLEECIGQAFAALGSALDAVYRGGCQHYSQDAPAIRVYSGLAEGADLRAAKVALKHAPRCKVGGVLPVAPEEHAAGLEDVAGMAKAEAQQIFADVCASPETTLFDLGAQAALRNSPWVAHEAVARVLLDQADLVLAVLDLDHAPRTPADREGPAVWPRGGARHTVERALGLDIGVLWIDPSATAPTLRGLLEMRGGEVEARPMEDLPSHLARVLQAVDPGATPAAQRAARRIKAYEDEVLPGKPRRPALIRALWFGFYLIGALWFGFDDGVRSILKRWPELGHPVTGTGAWKRALRELTFIAALACFVVQVVAATCRRALRGRLKSAMLVGVGDLDGCRESLNAEYLRADMLSHLYMATYRGAFMAVQLLGVLAVLLGVAGAVYWQWHLIVWGELVVLGCIALLVLMEKHVGWREKAIEYRVLAEQFRHARHLVPLGRILPYSRPPAHGANSFAEKDWMTRYFRAWLRAEGPQGSLRARSATAWLTKLIEDVKAWIRDQRQWQDTTARRCYVAHALLHRLTIVLFGVVCGVVAFHPLHPPNEAATHLTLGVLVVVVFPALIAALHGILKQGEFHHLAERAASMAGYLERELELLETATAGLGLGVAGATAAGGGGSAGGGGGAAAGAGAAAAGGSTTAPLALSGATPASTPAVVILGNHAVRIAATMMEETLDWMSVYYRHETGPT